MIIDFRNYSRQWSMECRDDYTFLVTGLFFTKWYVLDSSRRDSFGLMTYKWKELSKDNHNFRDKRRYANPFDPKREFDKNGIHIGLPNEVLQKIRKIV